jgi:glycosyltransferase involved in cell wall biosynthesis
MVRPVLPLISVCIPVFNGENYISECIDSVLSQTEKNFELIIADNCSTDNTLEIVAAYSDQRIKVFKNDSNLGSISNFNRCIELAKGEFFILLPHDDILLPSALKTFRGPFLTDPKIGIAYSSYYIINKNGERITLRTVTQEDKIMNSEESIREFILYGNPIQCAMVRKELFSHIGLFSYDLFVMCDIDMWSRIILDGNKAACFSTPQNCLRVYSDSGQQALLKPDKRSLGTLTNHLGYTPNPDFIRKNNYSFFVFEYLQKLFNRIPTDSDLQKLRPLSVNEWILESLIKHLFISLLRANWINAKQDTNLLARIVRWAGISGMIPVMIPVLASLPLDLMKSFVNRFRQSKNVTSI